MLASRDPCSPGVVLALRAMTGTDQAPEDPRPRGATFRQVYPILEIGTHRDSRGLSNRGNFEKRPAGSKCDHVQVKTSSDLCPLPDLLDNHPPLPPLDLHLSRLARSSLRGLHRLFVSALPGYLFKYPKQAPEGRETTRSRRSRGQMHLLGRLLKGQGRRSKESRMMLAQWNRPCLQAQPTKGLLPTELGEIHRPRVSAQPRPIATFLGMRSLLRRSPWKHLRSARGRPCLLAQPHVVLLLRTGRGRLLGMKTFLRPSDRLAPHHRERVPLLSYPAQLMDPRACLVLSSRQIQVCL